MTHRIGKIGPWLVPLLALAYIAPVHAQSLWDAVKDTVQHKATQAIEKSIDNPPDPRTGDTGHPSHPAMLSINGGAAFTAGNVPLFHGDLAATRIGAMPSAWKTNGSASVVSLGGMPGHWLKLANSATYKLVDPVRLPQHFTVQFDVIAVADKINDLDGFHFGFAHDNSVRNYIMDAYNDGAINAIKLNYSNSGGGSVASSATGYHHFFDFDLEGYPNRPLHVALDVNGDTMRVYLDHTKIADTKLFLGNGARHFFMSSSLNSKHGAAIVVGNFRIDGFEQARAQTAPSS